MKEDTTQYVETCSEYLHFCKYDLMRKVIFDELKKLPCKNSGLIGMTFERKKRGHL